MNDVAIPISPNSDQASTVVAGKTTSRTGWNSRLGGRREGGSISILGTSGLTGGSTARSPRARGRSGEFPGGEGRPKSRRLMGRSPLADKSRSRNPPGPRSANSARSRARPAAPARAFWGGRGHASGPKKTRLRPADLPAEDQSGRRGSPPRSRRGRRAAPAWPRSVDVATPDILPIELDWDRPALDSAAGTTRSALHRGHDTTEPALEGGDARSWLH